MVSCNPTLREIYGVDRQMNFHRSCDSGESWRQLTDGYLKDVQKENQLINSTALPENLVAGLPTADLRVTANSTGTTWGGLCICIRVIHFNFYSPRDVNISSSFAIA